MKKCETCGISEKNRVEIVVTDLGLKCWGCWEEVFKTCDNCSEIKEKKRTCDYCNH